MTTKIKYLFTFVANNVTMTEEEETEMEDVICPDDHHCSFMSGLLRLLQVKGEKTLLPAIRRGFNSGLFQ
jgi:hypothetical protein